MRRVLYFSNLTRNPFFWNQEGRDTHLEAIEVDMISFTRDGHLFSDYKVSLAKTKKGGQKWTLHLLYSYKFPNLWREGRDRVWLHGILRLTSYIQIQGEEAGPHPRIFRWILYTKDIQIEVIEMGWVKDKGRHDPGIR